MVAHLQTMAFIGIEARPVEVQVHVASGLPAFTIVGLADKAVAESRERVRAALGAVGLALPPKRITVNLAPADLPKEGSHFDLPIALALLVALDVVDQADVTGFVALGELGLDGTIRAVPGVLPAAVAANASGKGLICPAAQGGEAAWAGDMQILAPGHVMELLNHLKGQQLLSPPKAALAPPARCSRDLKDIKGQEAAKRALEVAAAGGHTLLMCGPPGSGKSLLASCLSGLLPNLTPEEALQVSMVASIAGELTDGMISQSRPFRSPHHSASMAALTGGGLKVKPGEVSLAHCGVLFLDELPEFQRNALDALRQPLETGSVSVARANAHVTFPARFQLIAEGTQQVAARVAAARDIQTQRYAGTDTTTNAQADGPVLEEAANLNEEGRLLMETAVKQLKLTARGYHRVLRVARTLADLGGSQSVGRGHLAEALSYRRIHPVA